MMYNSIMKTPKSPLEIKQKKEASAFARKLLKEKKFAEAREGYKLESLKVLNEQDAKEFLQIIADIDVAAIAFHKENSTAEDKRSYINITPFTKELHTRWICQGRLSEKQMMALVNDKKKKEQKQEARKNAKTFEAGQKYWAIKAQVTKIELVEVVGIYGAATTKVVLLGDNMERFIVKTNSKKLLDKFNQSLDEKVPAIFTGDCSWVSDNGEVSVFTSKGLRVTI